ncbi:MAG: hypothetical protein IT330_17670 [Anaerolineae bacterium]|nr:hypothetical protein [Anaerolineae bacterium]
MVGIGASAFLAASKGVWDAGTFVLMAATLLVAVGVGCWFATARADTTSTRPATAKTATNATGLPFLFFLLTGIPTIVGGSSIACSAAANSPALR